MRNFRDLVTTTWHRLELATTPSQLDLKLQILRKEIRCWNKETVGDIEAQVATCNQALMWITTAEEIRPLIELEKSVRIFLTERSIQIDKFRETKWRQRAKKQWIKEGDKNTRFFHAVATHQKRTNTITSLQYQGTETTQHTLKAKVFFEYFCNLIGKQNETVTSFDLQSIYTEQLLSQEETHSLTQPWTDTDITQAVHSWKNNKAQGPDDFA